VLDQCEANYDREQVVLANWFLHNDLSHVTDAWAWDRIAFGHSGIICQENVLCA
jgi:hypothetical protein